MVDRIEPLGRQHDRSAFSSGQPELTGSASAPARIRLLLADAIRRILGVGQAVAVFAIVVDAKDQHAALFYRRFGFQPFPSRPDRLYLLASSAAAALEQR